MYQDVSNKKGQLSVEHEKSPLWMIVIHVPLLLIHFCGYFPVKKNT